MTSARLQPFCKKHKIKIGCYDGFRVCPRKIAERYMALYMYTNHFCYVWKSNAISFNKGKEELNFYFRVVEISYATKMLKVLLNMNINQKKSNLILLPRLFLIWKFSTPIKSFHLHLVCVN